MEFFLFSKSLLYRFDCTTYIGTYFKENSLDLNVERSED
jgi:hypothetical protein